MYEILKQIAVDNTYFFKYARKDFANLFDEVEEVNKPHIFLDPVVTTDQFSEYNQVVERVSEGTFMILVSSDIDEADYDKRYQDNIKPLLDGANSTILEVIGCKNNLTVNMWRKTEVINVLDYNMDGLVINYSINERT